MQLAITVILAGLLIRSVNWQALRALLVHLQWAWIGACAGLFLIIHVINVVRWRYLLQVPSISYGQLLVDYGAGLFANNFLPTGVGGDAVRAALLSRDVPATRAVLSVGLDRAIGLVSFSALFVMGMGLGPPPSLDVEHWLSRASTIAYIGVGVMAIGLVAFVIVWRARPKLLSRVFDLCLRWSTYRKVWPARRWLLMIVIAYGISVPSNLLLATANWAAFQALSIDVAPGAAIWLTLIVALSLLVPIALNGLGVMESVYVFVLAHYSVPMTEALGAALSIRLLMMAYSLLGGLLSLRWKSNNSDGGRA